MDSLAHFSVSVILLSFLNNLLVIGNTVMFQPYYEVRPRPVPHVPFDGTLYVPMRKSFREQNTLPSDLQTSSIGSYLENRTVINLNHTNQANNTTKDRSVEDDRMKTARDSDQAADSPYGIYHRTDYEETASSSPSAYAPSQSKDISPTKEPTAKVPFGGLDFTALLHPTTAKIASKATGLMDIILALLGVSSFPNGEMKGFENLLVNGILRPLLVAKGGIKSLISKLTIPIVSLILINLEVLVTVWWLWEDCSLPNSQPTYSYPSHVSYNQNMSYR
ncbi:hypothetical protein RR46_09938 [Papilio xuthus]|uniref:Uncharacterized protein n=1 Tax=Papilio xuthus TaxID=66420 RepID=A0A194QCM5_PAPXU|nr:hypothetical protein RR46_09938 [Papilio xuthus]